MVRANVQKHGRQRPRAYDLKALAGFRGERQSTSGRGPISSPGQLTTSFAITPPFLYDAPKAFVSRAARFLIF
jgi:hypothetical protein